MTNIVDFPKRLKSFALTLSDNFDPTLDMKMVVDKLLTVDNAKDAEDLIVAIYNEGIIFGHVADGAVTLLESKYD